MVTHYPDSITDEELEKLASEPPSEVSNSANVQLRQRKGIPSLIMPIAK